MRKIKVLIAGRCREHLELASRLLADNDACRVEMHCISNGHVDPLHNVAQMPDLLLLCDLQGERELDTLTAMDPASRPALIVFGPGDNPATIRLAMRAGARDYLMLPEDAGNLHGLIEEIAGEVSERNASAAGSLFVFMNGKGGSGASFLAANVAHGLASNGQRVLLVDMDMQFAGLCRYLDMAPGRNMLDAVNSIEHMDEVSAQAYTSEHESGLRLLCASTENLTLHAEIPAERLVAMIKAYQSFNDFVVIDLPRQIDTLSAAVLAQADRIFVVTQQSFPHLHDTARLLQIFRKELGIPDSHVDVVVNRYARNAAIDIKDIENALQVSSFVRIPNHYKLASEGVNSGIPLAEVSRKGPVARELRAFYEDIAGVPQDDGGAVTALQSLFRR